MFGWCYNSITYFSNCVSAAEPLGLSFFCPGFEQLLEHGRLSPLAHHLHPRAGWIVFSFNVALEVEKKVMKLTWNNVCFVKLKSTKKKRERLWFRWWHSPLLCSWLLAARPLRPVCPSRPSHWSLYGPQCNNPDIQQNKHNKQKYRAYFLQTVQESKQVTEESSRSCVRGCVATSWTTRFPPFSKTL